MKSGSGRPSKKQSQNNNKTRREREIREASTTHNGQYKKKVSRTLYKEIETRLLVQMAIKQSEKSSSCFFVAFWGDGIWTA